MRGFAYLIPAAIVAAMLISVSGAAVVGTSAIHAPAVILFNNTGSLTTITLTISNGNGTVSFANESEIANDTRASANTAAQYAAFYTHRNFSAYNYRYSIYDGGGNVSGPSAGAAMTLLAVSAFEGKPLRSNFTLTGTISPSGGIGQIGGAIDKISAASAAKLSLMLVPWADPGSLEQGIYYIGQTEYKIPVVEVANISQAAAYAFSGESGVANEVTLNFTENYNVGGLPAAPLNCTNGCNETPFSAFTNYTIALAKAQIANISSHGFAAAGSQLLGVVNQTAEMHGKGYLYLAADIAFLSYLDGFYLGSYNLSRYQALSYMQNVQASCSGLTAPQLTKSNYEYVIGAELRQGWANYTINSTISGFNATGSTRDDIVSSMYSTGQAQAWCGAVSFLYGYQYPGDQQPVTFSQSLQQLALQKVNRADAYPGMYLTLATQAYKEGNYPVAIIDSDYAYALTSSQTTANATDLNVAAVALANNYTYGVWATEFSKEALFYVYESQHAKNSTSAQFYADQAYSSAALAAQVSNDTAAIYNSLVPGSSVSTGGGGSISGAQGSEIVSALDSLAGRVQWLTDMMIVTLALLAGCAVLLVIVAYRLMALSAGLKPKRRRKK